MRFLSGKNAIITGAMRGIGRATVEAFAAQGANIWACARKQDAAFETAMKQLAKLHGVCIWPVYFDMTNDTELRQAIQTIRRQKINVDILVNNAGIAADSTSFHMTTSEKIRHVFEVNFFAVTTLTQYVSRLMAKQKSGSIVNLASIAAVDGTPAQYEYAASKAAIIGATRNLARELAQYRIRVNAVAPGMIETDMGNQIDEGLKQATLSNVIMGRLGRPEEIASVIAFVASDLASYINGQVIRVDGGM